MPFGDQGSRIGGGQERIEDVEGGGQAAVKVALCAHQQCLIPVSQHLGVHREVVLHGPAVPI